METGTLDFEDLMDTGNFPGFEIAKFEPASEEKDTSNDADGVLRTPEHQPQNDFVLKESNVIKENGECSNFKEIGKEEQKVNDSNLKLDIPGESLDVKDNFDDANKSNGHDVTDQNDTNESLDGLGTSAENEPKVTKSVKMDEKHEHDQQEQAPKKKITLMPPKPKMKLWSGKQKNEDSSKENHSEESPEKPKRSPSKKAKNAEAEESPQQQSFLSFLNLQPGSSKPQDEVETNNEKNKTEDFYSRKRLRTRKKVSYAEDVMDDVDDEYKDDEEEEPYDHQINVPKRRRSSGSSNKLKESNAAIASAMAKYAQSLQKPTTPNRPIINFNAKPILPKTPQVSQQMYRNILASVTPKGDGLENNNPMKGLFECGLCGTFFNTAGQFISHQESAHGTDNKLGRPGMETFRCEICQFVLTNRFAYLEHKRMKHAKNQVTFNCNKCGSSFGYLIDLQKHKQLCGLPYTYTCTQCNLQLKDMQEMLAHKAKYHPPQTNTSTPTGRQWVSCAQKFCTFKCLTQMEMKHHVLNKHKLQMKPNELFPCNAPRCSKIFPTREKLTEHKREVHASEFIVQYQCMECKACYSTKTLLAEHQYLHMMDKLKKCDLCMRRFNTYNQLCKHKEVHTKKGTYKCTSCTRWCEDRQELATHICKEKKSKSIASRVYFCDICHHDFKSDEEMFKHRQIHKNYWQCSTCRWEEHSEEEYFKHREFHGLLTCQDCAEEIPTEAEMATHKKAHEFYIKMEEVEEEDGEPLAVMYLCPNLMNAIKV